jgi:hypothetical protein
MTAGNPDRAIPEQPINDSTVQDTSISNLNLFSQRDVDYSNLARLLRKKKWKEANEETLLKLLEASGRIEFLISVGRLVREDITILFLALDAQGRLKILKTLATSGQLKQSNLEALFQELNDWMSVPERLKLLTLELLLALGESNAFSEAESKKQYELLRAERSQERTAVKLFLAMATFGLITEKDADPLQQMLALPQQIRLEKIFNLAKNFTPSESYMLLDSLSSDETRLLRLVGQNKKLGRRNRSAKPPVNVESFVAAGFASPAFPEEPSEEIDPLLQRFQELTSNGIDPLSGSQPPEEPQFSEVLHVLIALDPSTPLTKPEPNALLSKTPSVDEYSFIKLLEIVEELRFSDEITRQELNDLLNHFVFSDEDTLQEVLTILANLDSSHRLGEDEITHLVKALSRGKFGLPKILKLLMDQDVSRWLKGDELEFFTQSLSSNGAALMKVLEILMNVLIFLPDRLNQKFADAGNALGDHYPVGRLSERFSKRLSEILLEAITDDRIKLVEMVTSLLKTAAHRQLFAADRPALLRLLNPSDASFQSSEQDRENQLQLLMMGWQHRGWHLTAKDFEYFPCTDLQSINLLWKKFSNGRFGFSAQQDVWNDSQPDGSGVSGEALEQFGDSVGWRTNNTWIDYKAAMSVITEPNAAVFWVEEAPRGHLPLIPLVGWWCWMGGMQAILDRLKQCVMPGDTARTVLPPGIADKPSLPSAQTVTISPEEVPFTVEDET